MEGLGESGRVKERFTVSVILMRSMLWHFRSCEVTSGRKCSFFSLIFGLLSMLCERFGGSGWSSFTSPIVLAVPFLSVEGGLKRSEILLSAMGNIGKE